MAKQEKKKFTNQWLYITYAFLVMLMGVVIRSIYPPWWKITEYCGYASMGLIALAIVDWCIHIPRRKPKCEDLSEKIEELFHNLNLKGGEKYPTLYQKTIDSTSEIYLYQLPAGLTLSDILKNKEAFEEYLNTRLKIYIKDGYIVIQVKQQK